MEKNFSFPVICFYGSLLRIRDNWDALVTTTTTGVKNGMFNAMLMVGVDGRAIRVNSARKLHGIGFFRGFNPMVGQRIKVALLFEGETFTISADDVRRKVLSSFEKWHGWKTREDFDKLKFSVEKASSIEEIIGLVK
jgi:hypothetical protein